MIFDIAVIALVIFFIAGFTFFIHLFNNGDFLISYLEIFAVSFIFSFGIVGISDHAIDCYKYDGSEYDVLAMAEEIMPGYSEWVENGRPFNSAFEDFEHLGTVKRAPFGDEAAVLTHRIDKWDNVETWTMYVPIGVFGNNLDSIDSTGEPDIFNKYKLDKDF